MTDGPGASAGRKNAAVDRLRSSLGEIGRHRLARVLSGAEFAPSEPTHGRIQVVTACRSMHVPVSAWLEGFASACL
jgi:hypothetical protein